MFSLALSGDRTAVVRGLALAAAIAVPGGSAHAAGTAAGTEIVNTATATYAGPAGPTTISSNTVTLRVDERLDVTVASADPGDVGVSPGATGRILKFTLTNGGNGPEAFGLTAAADLGGDDFDPAVTAIVLDANGNGAYDAGVDTVYVAGSNDPLLQPDEALSVFVLSTIPGTAADGKRGRAELTAAAKTGTGTPGTTFAGQGTGGVDAVVGATTARSAAGGAYLVSAATLAFVKSAMVADPFGGSRSLPGAIITYSLAASVTGSGALAGVQVADPIPAGTTYQAGTLTLDGAALTDAADSDAGSFSGNAVAVSLGTLPAASNRLITFKVKINP
ncbi:MAG: hypothetical protein QM676_07690 [Novosphingobium sp.]